MLKNRIKKLENILDPKEAPGILLLEYNKDTGIYKNNKLEMNEKEYNDYCNKYNITTVIIDNIHWAE